MLASLAGCAGPQLVLPKVAPATPAQRSWRVAGAGELVLRCTPADAEVALDGVSQGLCSDFDGEPHALKVGTAARRVEVKKSGFQTWESWLAADQTRVVMTVTLLPNGGSP
ncbi:MAG: hypothetical protein JNJ54_27070 [Myxococcaceae bacterium]|nr:hypothetical protein [Myxococcaceae bacterium]